MSIKISAASIITLSFLTAIAYRFSPSTCIPLWGIFLGALIIAAIAIALCYLLSTWANYNNPVT